jgi:hypothetical protein
MRIHTIKKNIQFSKSLLKMFTFEDEGRKIGFFIYEDCKSSTGQKFDKPFSEFHYIPKPKQTPSKLLNCNYTHGQHVQA